MLVRRSRLSAATAAIALCAGLIVLFSHARSAWAAGPTKEECIEAHSKGQDARESGQMGLARRLFLTCAQSTCPGLIQGDCARFSDELDRLQPTVTFSARDSSGADLPDTTVYVDGVLMSTHLSDGKIHDIDPGTHTIRFSNGGHDVTLTVVFNQGEKARVVRATFRSPNAAATTQAPTPVTTPAASRPVAPLLVAGAGVALMVTGGVLGVVGLNNVPSTCSLSTNQCAAPPGDAAFGAAQNGVTLADVGLAVGIVGAAATIGGLVWYFASPRQKETGTTIAPWMTASGGGFALGGTL